MNINELAVWLKERDHQVTLCLRVESQGLYIKMIDMKTGMVRMGLISNNENEESRMNAFKAVIDQMYKELMDALGREEKNEI